MDQTNSGLGLPVVTATIEILSPADGVVSGPSSMLINGSRLRSCVIKSSPSR